MNKQDRRKASQKVTLVGAIIDLALGIFKVIAGVLGNSGALIADGIHSFSDLLSDGVVLYASKHSAEEADDEHPYGHERFETVATLGLAIILAIIGVGIIYDAFERLFNPSELSHSTLLLSVAALSIFSKEALYWYTLKVASTYKSSMLKANAWHHRSDALSSVVVFIGILGSLNGYLFLDGVAAVVVGFMIIYIAWELGLGATKELVDSSIDADKVKQLRDSIGRISGVNNVHSLRTRKIGHTISCDVHVQVDPYLSVSEGHIISVSVERVAKECLENLNDVTVHIDPEDDETVAPYEALPERAEALGILTKALFNNKCDGEIERIQLHYLDSRIHVDFYLPLSCLDSGQSGDEILAKLHKTVDPLEGFGKIKVYFSRY
ncbi:cation diffusion facilitator family transporter [Candidatus Thioglobus sp.]|nr:cation diffusion facilitator family transporter [Candidatus Thioglobus sp.]MDB3893828.1 cation diffusion facilitator family transporter [Candidatus Thioglobus sp.]MDC0388691.1 cation diffusion facilitator family transporter [Candidatus Thioglobus sp.]MDC0888532.1 cation diffusion facilitator family transporter [Candidatus Thioglobus sp.]MDC0904768.1 cation diffusion facilitator family transporter [Candidatus Thioglobus sp.]